MQSPDSAEPKARYAELDRLVPRIIAGEADAFEHLFRTLHAPLVDFASRYTRDRERAEEIVQDVFFAVWQRRVEWRPRRSVRAYLFGSVRNGALNLRRRDAVEQDWVNEAEREELASHATAAAHAELEYAELLTRAQVALDALPERCRLVMHLRWREGLSYAEIADVMGIGVKGVENQLGRGLRSLRRTLLGG